MDISRPNIHDSKAEFQVELETVRGSLDQLRNAFEALAAMDEHDAPKMKMVERLRIAVNQSARQRVAGLWPTSAIELVRKNNTDLGLYISALRAIADLIYELDERLKDLRTQEKEFWSVKNRPAKYYPRTIASRLARLYANNKGKKPTIGVARDGGHPSTSFGRALEEVFAILEIDADVRRAAEWAIGELTDEDLSLPEGRVGPLLPASAKGMVWSKDWNL